MPKVPKWMANAMESLFSGMYHPVQVTAVEDLENKLRKIRFEGNFSTLRKGFTPGNVIEFRISDTEFRHYTPSYFNQEEGICEVLFYLHDKGPGSKWVADLKTGDRLNLLGPGGKIKYNPNFQTHIACGDETSLGVFACIKAEADKQGDRFLGIVELDKTHEHWTKILKLDSFTVTKSENPKGTETIIQLDKLFKSLNLNKAETVFYLTGNAKSILNIKKFLLKNDFSNKQIQTEPYWVEGKQGL